MKIDKLANTSKTRLSEDGGVVLPAEFREALGLRAGDAIIMALDDGVIRMWSLERAIQRLQELVRQQVPEGVSLADELIAERRREAESE
jgi:AbrB family looped-hinge helix DNA binding protein